MPFLIRIHPSDNLKLVWESFFLNQTSYEIRCPSANVLINYPTACMTNKTQNLLNFSFKHLSPWTFYSLLVVEVVFCVSVDTAVPRSNSSAPPFCSEHRSPDSLQTYFVEFQMFPWFLAWACHSLSPWQRSLFSWFFIQHTFEERSESLFPSSLQDCHLQRWAEWKRRRCLSISTRC